MPLALTSVQFNMSAVTADTLQYGGGRYERFKNALIFTSVSITLKFQVTDFATGGGTNLSFSYPRYGLNVRVVNPDGTLAATNQRASYIRISTERVGTFVGAFSGEPDGPCMLEIIGFDATGAATSLMQHGAYINIAGQAKNHPQTIVQNCSRDWESRGAMNPPWPIVYQYAIVPTATVQTTRVQPLPTRLGIPFATALDRSKLTRIEYVVSSDGVGTTEEISRSGVVTTEARQNYAYADLIAVNPRLPMLDGVRGVCTAPYTTDLHWGRNGKLYGANPWQAWVMDATGTKRTLYGLRHVYPPIWSEASLTGPEVEVVGNWDASIPATERFAWESWGAAFDPRTLSPIDDAAPIPPNETEHPHYPLGPVQFRTDRHGYILKAQFSNVSHATPAVVTRWCAVNDPWGIAYDSGKLYVTERGLNRISIWSADTPNTLLGVLIEDTTASALGSINQQDRRWAGAAPATCRTHTIVAPEGLVIQDGYAYWGSFAQAEVRRIPLAGGAVQVVCRPIVDSNSNYLYLAISDGNFGPRGTVFATTWSNANFGRPQAYLPTADAASDGRLLTNSVAWVWQGFAQNVIQGPGGLWNSDSYGSAVAVGRQTTTGRAEDPTFGALACSSAAGNVSIYTQSIPTDGPLLDQAKALAGGNYYRANFQILHGPWCAGPNLPLPFGADPNCDYFMSTICGYPQEDPIVIAQMQATIDQLTAQINTLQADDDAKAVQITTLTATIAAAKADAAKLVSDLGP